MRTLKRLFLAAVMASLLVSAGSAMPTDPLAIEKAGGAYALSSEVLAAPPEYVDAPLPIPAAGHLGNYKALLILIKFTDKANVFSRASFDSMAFLGWPTGTINQYYTEVSYGNLTLSGQVYGWYPASQTRAYYGNGLKGWGAYPQNTGKLVEEAVDAAETAGCNFAQFDNDGDGTAESIFIVHSGEGCETSLNTNDIQSHMSSITGMGGTARHYDGVTINTYVCVPELQKSTPSTHVAIGVYCHEYGHVLGLPDQYDVGRWCTSYSGWGVGAWALMGYGGWGGNVTTPASPTHICPWGKIKMGWLTPTVLSGVTSQTVTLSPIESNQQVLKLAMNSSESEYFLVAFYDSTVGFDRSLKKKGIQIFHVDDDTWSENDCENGGACTSGGFHYLVALEQPDAAFNLDCGTAGNYADRGDMFPYQTYNYFDGVRTPKATTYRGVPSGVAIANMTWIGGGRTQISVDVTSGVLYDEIGYDDGTRDICYAWGASNSGFAVKITPARYPALVRGLNIMSCDPYYPNFQCRLWDASGTGGKPGVPLSPAHTTTAATTYAWTYEDFSADNVAISSGDFWAVYIEYNNSDIASDNTSAWSGRTMTYYAGNFYVDNGAYGNYMIRAVLDTVYCAGVGPVGEPRVTAAAGPNPFTQEAVIIFSLDRPAVVGLAIYDVAGRLVRDLGGRRYEVGTHCLAWDGSDAAGKPAGAGIYFYRLESGTYAATGKLSLLR
jgi:M6 family metalloprotease-like protein